MGSFFLYVKVLLQLCNISVMNYVYLCAITFIIVEICHEYREQFRYS